MNGYVLRNLVSVQDVNQRIKMEEKREVTLLGWVQIPTWKIPEKILENLLAWMSQKKQSRLQIILLTNGLKRLRNYAKK